MKRRQYEDMRKIISKREKQRHWRGIMEGVGPRAWIKEGGGDS